MSVWRKRNRENIKSKDGLQCEFQFHRGCCNILFMGGGGGGDRD